jgi:tRNA dimethylallyltransferase
MNNRVVVILGPTASGKTDFSITLAKKFGGEIISADSRQVYKGFDIGSGKITKNQMQGVPHHLLDIANPRRKFTVAQFQKLALKEIKGIQKRGNVPFLVGGTGFYIQSIVDGLVIPSIKPNWKLRKKLERKSVTELFETLKKLDPARAKHIDAKNPRRLIRAIEIAHENQIQPLKKNPQFDALQIGIKKSPEELKKAIQKRLHKKIRGTIGEVKKLHRNGLSFKRLEEFGLEYRLVAQYIQDKITHEEMLDKIQKESEQFTKRQMTWFKRDKRIQWINNYKEGEKLVKNYAQKNNRT